MSHDCERTPPVFNVAEYAPVICIDDSCLKASSVRGFVGGSKNTIFTHSNGLQHNSNGLQPNSHVLQPNRYFVLLCLILLTQDLEGA